MKIDAACRRACLGVAPARYEQMPARFANLGRKLPNVIFALDLPFDATPSVRAARIQNIRRAMPDFSPLPPPAWFAVRLPRWLGRHPVDVSECLGRKLGDLNLLPCKVRVPGFVASMIARIITHSIVGECGRLRSCLGSHRCLPCVVGGGTLLAALGHGSTVACRLPASSSRETDIRYRRAPPRPSQAQLIAPPPPADPISCGVS
jgi:hypothetical protein